MGESVSVNLHDVSEDIRVNNTADHVVDAIIDLFLNPRVMDGGINQEVSVCINTYFSLGDILDVEKKYLFQCLDGKMKSAGLFLKKPENFDKFVEGSVSNEWEVGILIGKSLKNLFQRYFSLIKNLKGIKKMEDLVKFRGNLNDYNKDFNKILKFSESQFMEKTAWRKSGEGEEYCEAHLKNLLSPFKDLIAILKTLSELDDQEEKEKIFNKLVRDLSSFEVNKEEILEFCDFLDRETK